MAELPKYIMLRKVNETKTGVEYQVVEELPTQSNASNVLGAMTNADRIRAMTDEELAVVIAWPYLASPPWCSEHTTCPYINEDPTPCDKCALDWLREEGE